jgi:hypothetical protein
MPTISAHVVARPRKEWGCCNCPKPPDRMPHVVVYGYAEKGDRPYRMRVCLDCASSADGDTTVFLAAMRFVGMQRKAARSDLNADA